MQKVYILEGIPEAWKRAGLNKATGTIYDTQRDLKIWNRLFIEKQHGDMPPLKGPLAFYATYYMQIPKSFSPSKRESLNGTYHFRKPDTDNLNKFILDMVKGICIEDDCLIALESTRKIYDLNPRTVFTFVELNNDRIKTFAGAWE